MKINVILLFLIFLLSNCNRIYIEFNPIQGSIKVPPDYYIKSILIRCDSANTDSTSYNIELYDLKKGRSEIYLDKDYDNYSKEIKNRCNGVRGIIFVSIVSIADTGVMDCYWKIYRIDKKRPIIKLLPLRV